MNNQEEDLYKALSRQCKGNTGVAGSMACWFKARNKKKQVHVEILDTHGAGEYDTILLVDFNEVEDKATFGQYLYKVWKQLNTNGRLIVCVRNSDCSGDLFAFDRRELRKLLRSLGKVKILASQPFRWLVMYLDKGYLFPKSEGRRHRVLAEICSGSVLELGSGNGHLSAEIAAGGLKVTGVELNKAKSEFSRLLYPEVQFLQANILTLPEEVEPHDTVLLPEVIEHVDEEIGNKMLGIAWDLVKPGGRLVVSVPNDDLVPHPNHVTTFSYSSLKKLLGRFGSPVCHTDQPFKWLLMHVDKSDL